MFDNLNDRDRMLILESLKFFKDKLYMNMPYFSGDKASYKTQEWINNKKELELLIRKISN